MRRDATCAMLPVAGEITTGPLARTMTPNNAGGGRITPGQSVPRDDDRRLRVVEGKASLVAWAPDRPSDNLPIALSTFVGREREVAELKRLVEDTRLLTLT